MKSLKYPILMILLTCTLCALPAPAATLFVDDDACPTPGTGTELDPYCSIQTAINAATDTDEIRVAPGTYFEKINFNGKAIALRSTDGPETTIIDGTGLNDSVVKCISEEGPGTVINGFTITGGHAPAGGGMRNEDSQPTVTNCEFVGNIADVFGGGMYNISSNPMISNCTFDGNSSKFYGGGMSNTGGGPTMVDCTFSNNIATFISGGMHNTASSFPRVTSCTFSRNTADFSSGGMGNFGTSAPTVTNCVFIGNVATKGEGGGMTNDSRSNSMVTNCTFTGNVAGGSFTGGGGMYNGTSEPSVTNCTFIMNNAATGGGMYNFQANSVGAQTAPTVTNCLFIKNTAKTGGGMSCKGTRPAVTNCTFTGNKATISGGGMYNVRNRAFRADTSMTNCIFWGNSGPGGMDASGQIHNGDPIGINNPIVNYSNIQGGWSGFGSNNINADPSFINPEAGDYRLANGSPCINAGSLDAPNLTDTDIDGNPRINDGVVDMGAYETWDCNNNLIPDVSEIDSDEDEVIDECDNCPAMFNPLQQDLDKDDIGDICDSDMDGDGVTNDVDNCPIDFNSDQLDSNSNGAGDVCDRAYNITTDMFFSTIQAAIEDAENGDEIVVAPGTYNESINFLGKKITLRSSGGAETTVIDATGLDRAVVKCKSGETSNTVLDGFTITGGIGEDPTFTFGTFAGGGMLNVSSSPTVVNCIFTKNTATAGGGMLNLKSSPRVENCIFAGNTANHGGGMYNGNTSRPRILNCMFIANQAGDRGGAMCNSGGPFTPTSPTLINCEFYGNAAYRGGGIFRYGNGRSIITNCTFSRNTAEVGGGTHLASRVSNQTLTNCIFWENSDSGGTDESAQIDISSGNVTVNSSNVQGNWTGAGSNNINADPRFLDPDNGDFRLAVGSPSIDAGDNTAVPIDITTDLAGNPRFIDNIITPNTGNGTPPIVDMGAYEAPATVPADIDFDGDVDNSDFAFFAACFNKSNTPPRGGCSPAQIEAFDFDDDNDVDTVDFATFASCFNKANHPPRLLGCPQN